MDCRIALAMMDLEIWVGGDSAPSRFGIARPQTLAVHGLYTECYYLYSKL